MLWHVVDELQEEDWSQCTSLWHSRCDSCFFKAFTIYYYPLGSVLQDVFNPVQSWPLYAIVLDLFEETFVWDYIKSFAEVHNDYVFYYLSL